MKRYKKNRIKAGKTKREESTVGTIPTTEKLAQALLQAGAPEIMLGRAKSGYYDDYKSPIATPIKALVDDARKYNLPDIATRAMAGEFDGTKEEGDEWATSPEGQEIFKEFFKGMRP